MRWRPPLYAQVLGWFFLNVLVVGGVLVALALGRLGPGLDWLVSSPAGDHLRAAMFAVQGELRRVPGEEWTAVLARFGEAYGVTLRFVSPEGTTLAGEDVELPVEVREAMLRFARVGPGFGRGGGRGAPEAGPPPGGPGGMPGGGGDPETRPVPPVAPGGGAGPVSGPGADGPPARGPLFLVRSRDPVRYWAGVPAFFREPPPGAPRFGVLVVESRSLEAGGLFVNTAPFLWVIAGAALLSALIWLPFVRILTRRLGAVTRATERIADGAFDVAVGIEGADEIGRLGRAVHILAGRLDQFVRGQRRFLGDIAHELCSPLARARMALGVLESRLPDGEAGRLRDVEEELEQLSALANELLVFSRASLRGPDKRLESVALHPLLEEVVRRDGRGAGVVWRVPEGLRAGAEPELLRRAVGNVLRNALRYAASGGPPEIEAVGAGEGTVEIRVRDRGPGIPEEHLARVLEPFYRPDASRTAETGGAGLGLAIARTCAEGCGGTLRLRNREGGGLEVIFTLPAEPPAPPGRAVP